MGGGYCSILESIMEFPIMETAMEGQGNLVRSGKENGNYYIIWVSG